MPFIGEKTKAQRIKNILDIKKNLEKIKTDLEELKGANKNKDKIKKLEEDYTKLKERYVRKIRKITEENKKYEENKTTVELMAAIKKILDSMKENQQQITSEQGRFNTTTAENLVGKSRVNSSDEKERKAIVEGEKQAREEDEQLAREAEEKNKAEKAKAKEAKRKAKEEEQKKREQERQAKEAERQAKEAERKAREEAEKKTAMREQRASTIKELLEKYYTLKERFPRLLGNINELNELYDAILNHEINKIKIIYELKELGYENYNILNTYPELVNKSTDYLNTVLFELNKKYEIIKSELKNQEENILAQSEYKTKGLKGSIKKPILIEAINALKLKFGTLNSIILEKAAIETILEQRLKNKNVKDIVIQSLKLEIEKIKSVDYFYNNLILREKKINDKLVKEICDETQKKISQRLESASILANIHKIIKENYHKYFENINKLDTKDLGINVPQNTQNAISKFQNYSSNIVTKIINIGQFMIDSKSIINKLINERIATTENEILKLYHKMMNEDLTEVLKKNMIDEKVIKKIIKEKNTYNEIYNDYILEKNKIIKELRANYYNKLKNLKNPENDKILIEKFKKELNNKIDKLDKTYENIPKEIKVLKSNNTRLELSYDNNIARQKKIQSIKNRGESLENTISLSGTPINNKPIQKLKMSDESLNNLNTQLSELKNNIKKRRTLMVRLSKSKKQKQNSIIFFKKKLINRTIEELNTSLNNITNLTQKEKLTSKLNKLKTKRQLLNRTTMQRFRNSLRSLFTKKKKSI